MTAAPQNPLVERVAEPATLRKLCIRCSETKPLDDYHLCKTGTQGRAHWCKACYLRYYEEQKAERRERREAEKAARKAAQEAGRAMLDSLEGQAKVKRPCDRTRKRRRQQLLRQPNPVCFYCGHGFDPELLGLPLKQTERGWKKARRMARPTLEHLVAVSAGGTLARQNCELAHAICNIAAGSIPLADKLALAERKRAAFGQVAPEAWWKAQLEWEATARRSVVAA